MVNEGDLVMIEFPFGDRLVGDSAPSVIGFDREGNSVDVPTGTYGIAFRFEYERDRRWWIFLSTGKKVSVPAKTVMRLAPAGFPG